MKDIKKEKLHFEKLGDLFVEFFGKIGIDEIYFVELENSVTFYISHKEDSTNCKMTSTHTFSFDSNIDKSIDKYLRYSNFFLSFYNKFIQ